MLGAPRAANPLAPSKQRGGGSIPLAPSSKNKWGHKWGQVYTLHYFLLKVKKKVSNLKAHAKRKEI